MSYDEDYEDNNYDDYEPGNYNFYDLINDFEDLALKILKEMLKQKGNHFVYNPDHGQWGEFLKQIKRQISNEKLEGMTDENLKALGLNTFACRILKTNRERRAWQWQTFGLSLSPEVIFWQILDEIRPEVIDELYDEPLKKFIKLNDLSEKYNHSNYVKKKLNEEKNTDEEKENYLKTISTLKEEFIESIKKWCKKHNFVNQNDKPLKWCLQRSEEIVNQQRKVIAGLRPKSTNSDNRTIWHPKYMPEILCSNQIQNKKTAPFFFDHSGWDPKTQTREHAAREIRKDFEKDLNSYLNLIGQLHGINRKSKQDYSNSLEDHIKWLILYQCSPYFSDREIIDKCAKDQETQQKASNRKEKNVENYNVQAISSGIRNVARLLQMKVREKPKK